MAGPDLTELQKGRQRFSSLVAASSQIVWVTDAQGKVCEDSLTWRSFTGQSVEQWMSSGWADAVHPDYQEKSLQAWKRSIETGTPLSIEYPLWHRSGVWKWTHVRAVPQRDNCGKIDSWVGMITDIDQQKNAIMELERREQQIRSLVSSTAEGIYGIDLEGKCTFANEACARLLGFETTDDLLGKPMHAIAHHSRSDGTAYHVDDCKIHQAYLKGDQIHVDDEVFWRKDGSSFDVEYWSYPQRQDNTLIGCVVTFVDITERKKLATELADRESHLRRVIDNMLGFVGVLDIDGTLHDANQTTLLAGGLTRDEVVGKPFWECYWWSHDELASAKLQAAIEEAKQGNVVRYDAEVRMAGDSRMVIDFMLVPVTDADGMVTHLIPSGTDISERKAAELEIQRRVSQLDLSLESGRMGIWEWSFSTDYVDWSARLCDMFGYNRDTLEPTRAGLLNIVYPDDRSKLEQMIESASEWHFKSHEIECRIVRGDNGKIVWTHCRGTIRRDSNGDPVSILVVAMDITERKQRELSLAFLADLHSRLAGMTLADEIIAETGRRVVELLQLSHFLLIEMDEQATQANVIYDYCCNDSTSLVGVYDMSEFASEEERQRLVNGHPMVINDTSETSRSAKTIKNFSALKVGAIINVPSNRDRQLRFILSAIKPQPHRWRDDELDLMRQLANITRLKLERASTEAALRESESRFHDLADNISQFAWMADASGSIFWFNQRWYDYTGTTLEEMREWGWQTVHHPEHVDRVVLLWKEHLSSGEVWEDTFPLRSKDGEYRWFLSRAQPIRDNQGNIQRWFGTNTDITMQREFERSLLEARVEAEAANQSKSEFLANMSHEIRTPMTAILGYTDLVAEKVSDADTMEHIRTIRRNGSFLLEIINDILDLSKIEAGKFEVSRQRLSPQSLIEDVRSIMEVRASTSNTVLEVEYQGKIPGTIESDPKRLKQILINLVGNAIKFTPSGSIKIVVSYSVEAEKLRIDVIDSGIGISEKQLQKLFLPFSQGDGNVNREFGGTGLGLAISKRLTEMLGGNIVVESALGKGSRFTVNIDTGSVTDVALVDSIKALNPSTVNDRAHDVELNCHVLVVDDRRDIRFLSKRFLTSAGATVTEAEDGEIAVAKVAQSITDGEVYDLILLDMQMPRLDGYETAKSLRQLGYSKPIVALTADAMQGDMSRCIESGCNDYLSKPIDRVQLLELVNRLTRVDSRSN